MNKFKGFIFVCAALGLIACGNGGESAKNNPSGGKAVSAEKAKTAEQAVDVYAANLNRIADSIEAVESDADAEKAAKVIAEAAKEFEILAEKFDGANEMQMAAAFAKQAKEFSEPQLRIALAMQKLAMENPEYLEKISEAMSDMPPVQ